MLLAFKVTFKFDYGNQWLIYLFFSQILQYILLGVWHKGLEGLECELNGEDIFG